MPISCRDICFKAELCTSSHGVKHLHCIFYNYKLRIVGVLSKGPSYIYSNNMLVVTNYSKPKSTLKIKIEPDY